MKKILAVCSVEQHQVVSMRNGETLHIVADRSSRVHRVAQKSPARGDAGAGVGIHLQVDELRFDPKMSKEEVPHTATVIERAFERVSLKWDVSKSKLIGGTLTQSQ